MYAWWFAWITYSRKYVKHVDHQANLGFQVWFFLTFSQNFVTNLFYKLVWLKAWFKIYMFGLTRHFCGFTLKNIFVNWLRGDFFWLETTRLFTKSCLNIPLELGLGGHVVSFNFCLFMAPCYKENIPPPQILFITFQ